MTKSKVIKNILYTLITISAIFCVSGNVKAVDNSRQDGITGVAGSLGDDKDYTKDTTTSGTVKGTLSGTSCSLFNVSVNHNASLTSGSKSASGKFIGPYIGNQGNMVYNVVGVGPGCEGSSYVAFCLDPNFDGVKTGQTIQYKAEPVDPNSVFGKRIYELYKTYNGGTDDATYFTYEVAARIIALWPGSDYQSRSNTAKGRFNSHLDAYRNGNAPSGSVSAAAKALAAEAVAAADGNTSLQNETLGLSLNQLGGSSYTGGSYGIIINAVVENCPDEKCLGASVSISGGATQVGDPVYDAGAKTLTFTYSLAVDPNTCTESDVNATLTYNTSNDIRKAMQISPVSPTYDDRQNYIVFATGGGEAKVQNSLTVSNCGDDDDDDDDDDDACEIDAQLACDAEDVNFIVVNEGSKGNGSTDWENCIIGHTDPRGNSYDVVNTTKLYRKQAKDQRTLTDDNALGDRTDAIIGYTSDGSGGGTLSGDEHSIDDSDFCIISCKEKYAFLLPGNKTEVKQGTYFSFQVNNEDQRHAVVGISAERLCVSSGIKNGSFNNRVIDLRKQQVDFYNMYLYYKQLYNAMYSKAAMVAYRNTKTGPDCNDDPADVASGERYKEWRDRGCSDILTQEKFYNNWYVPSWSGSEISFEYQWFSLPGGGNNLNSTDLKKEQPIKVNLSQSFEEVMKSNLQIDKKDFSFYNKYYSDYANAWNYKMHVERYIGKDTDPYTGEETKYHKWWYNRRKVDSSCVGIAGKTVEDCYEYFDFEEKDYYAEVRYLPDSYKHEAEWNDPEYHDLGGFVYKKYSEAMKIVKTIYELAKSKYEALNAQIGIQSDAMQECTNYLDNFDEEKNPYRFDPVITFSYPSQEQYMAMLAPNRLENMNDGEAKVEYEKFYGGGGDAASVFSGSQVNAQQVVFGFGNLYDDTGNAWIEDIEKAKLNIPTYKYDKTAYYNVGRVGSRASYGRFDANGNSCNPKGKYIPDAGSKDSYCYEFYQSAKQFYVQAPDGLVTTSPSGSNKTILSTDGRVYPVAINTPAGTYPFYVSLSNIGQFGESTSLGRLMGGGNGKKGVLTGEYGDTQVCNYTVERIDVFCVDNDGVSHYTNECNDDESTYECKKRLCPGSDKPICSEGGVTHYKNECNNGESLYTCEKRLCPNNNNKCKTIEEQDCNNGDVSSPQKLSDNNYVSCLTKLMKVREGGKPICCDTVKKYKDIRTGYWAKQIPGDLWNDFFKYCDDDDIANACKGFTIISQETATATTNLSDISSVNNDGSLQINARAVSLNNLFPNSQMGVNWKTKEAANVITKIQEEGEGIFGKDPDYKAVVDAKCASAIKNYNKQEEGNGSGYGNGGFNDYTSVVTDAHTKDDVTTGDLENHAYNTNVVMSDTFRDILSNNCSFDADPKSKAEPDTIDGSVDSSLVKEPWNS